MNDYTVKVKIQCVVYKDYYVKANTGINAKLIVQRELFDSTNNLDCSGDYDEEQLFHKQTVVKVEIDN